jgi:cobalt/nickel transport system permease protein
MYCPYGWNITIPEMLGAHLIAGALDGVLTAGVYSFVTRLYPDVIWKDTPRLNAAGKRVSGVPVFAFLAVLIVLTPIGLIASGDAFGEWSPSDLQTDAAVAYKINFVPKGMQDGFHYKAPLDDYGGSVSVLNAKNFPHPFSSGDALDPNAIAGYLISAIAGAAILMILYKVIAEIVLRRKGGLSDKA